MKYIFNGFTLVDTELFGIQRNTIELLKELDNITDRGEIEVLVPPSLNSKLSFKNVIVKRIGVSIKGRTLSKKIKIWFWKNIFYKVYVMRNKKAITIDSILCFSKPSADVLFIYDCIPNLFPGNYITKSQNRARRKLLNRQKKAVEGCKVIITDSYCARNDILKIYDPKCPINVIYCGWQHFTKIEENEEILKRLGLTKYTYYFSLGSRLPHKNSKWITKAAKINTTDIFVITGSNLSHADGEEDFSGTSNVIYTGYLEDKDIKTLMRYCKAFIQPSFYEGFGIPPMEAMSVGAKCIVSNVSSLPEVYGEYAVYIDPNDPTIDLEEMCKKKVKDSAELLNYYSWKKSAIALYDILKKMKK